MPKGERGDALSGAFPVTGISFRPTYGIDLGRDADACRKVRAKTAETLCVDNI